VVSLSPDARVDETMGSVYRVDIALNTTHVDHEGEAVALRAGQTASAEIVVRRRRIIDLILDPIRKLKKGNISL
jgi:hemolysin D